MNEPLKYALKILGIKDYFEAEIREKLSARFGEEEAAEVIGKLRGYGYINDERAASNYISRKLRSGYGPYYIKDKLFQRGMETDAEEIQKIAEKDGIDMEATLLRLSERYKDKNGDPAKNFAKCISFLTGRGFSTGLCFRILKKGDFEK